MIDHFGLKVEEITKVVTDVHLVEFTEGYGEQWQIIPAYLELKSIVARDIKKSNMGERVKRHEFFNEWKTQKKSGATYERLVYALLKIGHREDADALCMMLKSSPDLCEESSEFPNSTQASSTGINTLTVCCKKADNNGLMAVTIIL